MRLLHTLRCHWAAFADIYVAYKFSADTSVELKENVEMLKRVVTAVDRLCPKLEFVVNQTGSKTYGCHLLRNRPAYLIPPFVEDRDKLKQPEGDDLFYFPQLAWLTEFARDRSWLWCETRPDMIVGFVPNFNFYSLASALGFYLSLFREINGDGAECAFPGNSGTWVAKSQDSSADMIARQTIHVALASGTKKGQAFNVADHRDPKCWQEKWPIICRFFGLNGVKIEQEDPVDIRQYIKQNYGIWEGMERKYGLQSGHADNPKVLAGHESFLLSQFDTDRQFDMSRMYDEAGFKEERSVEEGWGPVFERMRKAKLIPAEFK